MSQQKINRNQVSLPKFSGTESLQGFINQLENAARLGNWTPDYLAGQLYAQLTGGALQFIDTKPAEQRGTYAALVTTLRDRYEGDLERDRSREQLRACRRRKNESLEDLASRIKELARKAYTPDRREEKSVAAFRGAVSDKLSEVVIQQDLRTVDQCVTLLGKIEANTEGRQKEGKARVQQVVPCEGTDKRQEWGGIPMEIGPARQELSLIHI